MLNQILQGDQVGYRWNGFEKNVKQNFFSGTF